MIWEILLDAPPEQEGDDRNMVGAGGQVEGGVAKLVLIIRIVDIVRTFVKIMIIMW